MLPRTQQVLFLVFAAVMAAFAMRAFYRLYRRIQAGREDTDVRFDRLPARLWYALVTTLTQSRTFRKRPVVSFFHSFIFYGFVFYLLVNLLDAIDGYIPLSFAALGTVGHLYVIFADVLSALVFVGVIALVFRRFLLPSRRDFAFSERTLLHPDVRQQYVAFDSLVVSAFILFHVGSRAIGAGAKIAAEGPDRFAPFASLLAHLFTPQNALTWRVFGYWGALGSVLAFLVYIPYSKHIHIFMAPAKYLVTRHVSSGVLPAVDLDLEADTPKLGAQKLEDLAWPRLLDAYACIQCNRCQDVCPASATGKSLSPSALEINKRMELNQIAKHNPAFERGAPSEKPLLTFALTAEAAWACTTCGACIDVCPVGDEPMLDLIDIRRQQVMMEGEFPTQLQTAFRGMERAKNPWGISHEKRLDWAEGLNVPTTDQKPEPDVLFWVGCAASYDPQSQKTARAFVQLLDHAGVDYAVLGKRECCTGDSARRAGNEYLYRQLADTNVATLNEVKPKLIVATCPHCLNTVGKEYKQVGGDFKVVHHTEYLASLVADGKIAADSSAATVTYHDPCYLGRHNGVYDAPRNLLNILSNSVKELPRNRENSFCCGAGGAQFWKEEEEGTERISDNRFREVEERLSGAEDKILAVGCPFCKSMLQSTPGKATDAIAVKDIAEMLLEGVQRKAGKFSMLKMEVVSAKTVAIQPSEIDILPPTIADSQSSTSNTEVASSTVLASPPEIEESAPEGHGPPEATVGLVPNPEGRKKWLPRAVASGSATPVDSSMTAQAEPEVLTVKRKKWKAEGVASGTSSQTPIPPQPLAPEISLPTSAEPQSAEGSEDVKRKVWRPKTSGGTKSAETGPADGPTSSSGD